MATTRAPEDAARAVRTAGLRYAPPDRWRRALARARRHGAFLGTRPGAFPEDFAVFARFNRELRAIPDRHPAPDPLPLTAVEAIIAKLDTGRRVAQAG